MKTNNIFRAFLMAVALFMGIGSVQAVDLWTGSLTSGICYDGHGGDGQGSIEIPYSDFEKYGAKEGSVLRIYATLNNDASNGRWKVYLATNWYGTLGLADWPTDSGDNLYESHNSNYDAANGYIKATFGAETMSKIANGGNSIRIHFLGLTVSRVELIPEGTGEPVTPQTYTITVPTDIANGSITANSTSAQAGDEVTLTITPNSGYELDWVKVQSANGSNVTVTNNKFTMPASNVTVSGAFKAIPVTANIGTTGYATFCSDKALDFSRVSALKAYYAKEVSNGVVVLAQVTGTVAAGTGLVLKGSTAAIPVATSGTQIQGNLLVGVLSDTNVQAADSYVLTVESNVVKFASTQNKQATVPANHAYLKTSASASRLMVAISGETTGIEDRTLVSQEANVYYDLRGMRVEKPTHGIYIINGKKVFVK